MPRKVFTAGEILTAADVNTNLMDQAVMVFDDSAARGSAIPSPSEGMVTYLKDTDSIEKYDGSNFVAVGAAGIGSNVVSTALTTGFSTSSATFTAITGLDATITPSSNTAKVLVQVHLNGTQDTFNNNAMRYRIMRDSTVVGVGTSVGSRDAVTGTLTMPQQVGAQSGQDLISASMTFLDTPNTATAVTYSIEVRSPITQLIFLNRTSADTDSSAHVRSISTLTVMEVAA